MDSTRMIVLAISLSVLIVSGSSQRFFPGYIAPGASLGRAIQSACPLFIHEMVDEGRMHCNYELAKKMHEMSYKHRGMNLVHRMVRNGMVCYAEDYGRGPQVVTKARGLCEALDMACNHYGHGQNLVDSCWRVQEQVRAAYRPSNPAAPPAGPPTDPRSNVPGGPGGPGISPADPRANVPGTGL